MISEKGRARARASTDKQTETHADRHRQKRQGPIRWYISPIGPVICFSRHVSIGLRMCGNGRRSLEAIDLRVGGANRRSIALNLTSHHLLQASPPFVAVPKLNLTSKNKVPKMRSATNLSRGPQPCTLELRNESSRAHAGTAAPRRMRSSASAARSICFC